MVEEKLVIKEKATFKNPHKERLDADRIEYAKLTTEKQRIEFVAKKLGLIE